MLLVLTRSACRQTESQLKRGCSSQPAGFSSKHSLGKTLQEADGGGSQRLVGWIQKEMRGVGDCGKQRPSKQEPSRRKTLTKQELGNKTTADWELADGSPGDRQLEVEIGSRRICVTYTA